MTNPFAPPPGDAASLRAAAAKLSWIAAGLHTQQATVSKATQDALTQWYGLRTWEFFHASLDLTNALQRSSGSLHIVAAALTDFARAIDSAQAAVAELKHQADSAQRTADEQASKLRPDDNQRDRIFQRTGVRIGQLQNATYQCHADLGLAAARCGQAISAELSMALPAAGALTPDQIRRRVDDSYGITNALRNAAADGALTAAQAWGLIHNGQRVDDIPQTPPPDTGLDLVGAWWSSAPEIDQKAYLAALPADGGEPPLPKGATAINALWKTLPPALRTGLVSAAPRRYGNLDGILAVDRSTANVIVANADIAKVNAALAKIGKSGASDDWVLNHLSELGVHAQDYWRYHNAVVCLAGINKAREDNIGGVASFLWLYEPEAFDGKGRCAITIGDPDTADNTVMLVAGLEAKVDNRMGNPDAVHVFNEAHYADPTHSTVVVNWMGYNAPGFSNVAVDHAAKHGATLLASDAAALRATHQGAPTDLTLIGDSYGSTTVADSIADDGLRADNVVLTGSPGVDDAGKSSALGSYGHVYVGSASHDPITNVAHNVRDWEPLGNDSAMKGYGAIRFDAESVNRDNGGIDGYKNHSHYFDPNSESLYNIADIVTGHGTRILTDGNHASGRHGAGWGPWHHIVDPELGRTPHQESHG